MMASVTGALDAPPSNRRKSVIAPAIPYQLLPPKARVQNLALPNSKELSIEQESKANPPLQQTQPLQQTKELQTRPYQPQQNQALQTQQNKQQVEKKKQTGSSENLENSTSLGNPEHIDKVQQSSQLQRPVQDDSVKLGKDQRKSQVNKYSKHKQRKSNAGDVQLNQVADGTCTFDSSDQSPLPKSQPSSEQTLSVANGNNISSVSVTNTSTGTSCIQPPREAKVRNGNVAHSQSSKRHYAPRAYRHKGKSSESSGPPGKLASQQLPVGLPNHNNNNNLALDLLAGKASKDCSNLASDGYNLLPGANTAASLNDLPDHTGLYQSTTAETPTIIAGHAMAEKASSSVVNGHQAGSSYPLNLNGVAGGGVSNDTTGVRSPSEAHVVSHDPSMRPFPPPVNGGSDYQGRQGSASSSAQCVADYGPLPLFGSSEPMVPQSQFMTGNQHARQDGGIHLPAPLHVIPPAHTIENLTRPIPLGRMDRISPATPQSVQGSISPFTDRDLVARDGNVCGGNSPRHYHHAPVPLTCMINPSPVVDNGDNLLDYVRAKFDDPGTSDCTVEFRFAHGSDEPPVVLNGHRLILTRSEVLRRSLDNAVLEQTEGKRRLVLQLDDANVKATALYMALQRLYGHPLLASPLPPMGLDTVGNSMDRLDFALSYIAAGHFLGVPPVLERGLEIASQLISWDTIERAFCFAFRRAPIPDVFPGAEQEIPPNAVIAYGDRVHKLMGCIRDFVLENWPNNFNLDRSNLNPGDFDRLPNVDSVQANNVLSNFHGPRVSGGRSLSNIQFGDINPSLGGFDNKSSREMSILSRILINMPYAPLKTILESTIHSGEERLRIISAVVQEREERRLRIMKRIQRNGCKRATEMRTWLERGGSLKFGNVSWCVLGWKENVSHDRETGLACLGRSWFCQPVPPPHSPQAASQ